MPPEDLVKPKKGGLVKFRRHSNMLLSEGVINKHSHDRLLNGVFILILYYHPAAAEASSAALVGGSTPEMGTKTTTTVDHSANSNAQGHHQITITSAASNIKATTTVDGRCAVRRNSFKRSQASWLLDPRKVLFFFATLSSIGTLLLICFTLSIVQSDDAAILE